MKSSAGLLRIGFTVLFGLVGIANCQTGNVFKDISEKLDSFQLIEQLKTEFLATRHPVEMYSEIKQTMFEVLENMSFPYQLEPDAISESSQLSCAKDLFMIVNSARKGQLWALKFLDAWGKLLPGLSELNFVSYGDFPLCRSLHYEIPVGRDQIKTMDGKHCMVRISVDNRFLTLNGNVLGICVPRTCKGTDLGKMFSLISEGFLPQSDRLHFYTSVTCNEKMTMSVPAVLIICLAVLLICLTISATIVHYIDDRKKWKLEHENALGKYDEISPNTSTNQPGTITEERKGIRRRIARVFFAFLHCFSLKRNIPKIFTMSSPREGTMECMNGIRVLTLIWIALSHTWMKTMTSTSSIKKIYVDLVDGTWTQFLINGTISPDSFLTLGGLVVTYSFLYDRERGKKMNWIAHYVNRYLRLAPPCTMVVLLTGFTMKYWLNAPTSSELDAELKVCNDIWWQNVLLINNFFKNVCLAWTWYVAVDFQLFAVSPLFLIPLSKKPKLGLVLIFTSFLASAVYTGWSVYYCHFAPNGMADVLPPKRKCDQWSENYTAPWVRCNAYFVGMIAGYILFKTKKTIHIPKPLLALGWIVATTCSMVIIFILKNRLKFRQGSKPLSDAENISYSVLYRPVWAMCVSWVIIVCVTKNAKPVNTLLSLPIFQPLARLSYSVYLIHLSIMTLIMAALPSAPYYTHSMCFVQACGIFLLTLVASVPFSLICETPFLNMFLPKN